MIIHSADTSIFDTFSEFTIRPIHEHLKLKPFPLESRFFLAIPRLNSVTVVTYVQD